jgi:hypothetical protein
MFTNLSVHNFQNKSTWRSEGQRRLILRDIQTTSEVSAISYRVDFVNIYIYIYIYIYKSNL